MIDCNDRELLIAIDRFDFKGALLFMAVVDTGSLKAAATLLGYSLPSVSLLLKRYRIKNSKDYFTREGRNLVPTEEAILIANNMKLAFKSLLETIE